MILQVRTKIVILSLCLQLSAAHKCPNTWTAFGHSCYKLIEEQTSWHDAHVSLGDYSAYKYFNLL